MKFIIRYGFTTNQNQGSQNTVAGYHQSRKVLVINETGNEKGEKHGDGENGKNSEGYKEARDSRGKDGEGDAEAIIKSIRTKQLHEHLRT
jgi:hypothetical protein